MEFPSSLPIPDEVVRIARELSDAGHETWCVGGAVRDNLLQIENKDFDLATAATPQQVRELFRRTVPVGVEHGTVGVLDASNRLHEVTTFREDVRTDGRHAEVEFGVSLEADLARRDFTINAIAYHPLSHKWFDPFKGQNDLDAQIVRAVGQPEQRFREDYLRILRAIRFAARFGFEIERATWDAAKATVDGVRHLSAERVRDEWFGGLSTALDLSRFVELWVRTGALEHWLPEVLEHAAVSPAEGLQPMVRGALDRFPGADGVLLTIFLASDPVEVMRRLKCSRAVIRRAELVSRHRNEAPDGGSELDVRRWMSVVGDAVDDLVCLTVAADFESGQRLGLMVDVIRRSKAPLAVGDLAVDGSDLIALGVPPGPHVGRVLERLLDRVLDEPHLNTKETLRSMAQALVGSTKR